MAEIKDPITVQIELDEKLLRETTVTGDRLNGGTGQSRNENDHVDHTAAIEAAGIAMGCDEEGRWASRVSEMPKTARML